MVDSVHVLNNDNDYSKVGLCTNLLTLCNVACSASIKPKFPITPQRFEELFIDIFVIRTL